LILLTGATGYVGGRLLRALLERGERVRCLARRPDELRRRVPAGVEVVGGDVLDASSLDGALAGVEVAYYLIHSMGSRGDFEAEERRGATSFALAARIAGVRRIVYLGGLGDDSAPSSPHLASRHAVGRILRESGVPTIELRAPIVIGSGGLSFEMVRALVERLPVLITPRWVLTEAQPIAIEDVLNYLVAAADVAIEGSEIVEIGGPDRVSYLDLMREYGRQRRLRRLYLRVPVLTPRLSSLWLGLVTPLYARVGRKLIDSLRTATIVRSTRARELFPQIEPRGMREAMARALVNEDRELAETRWSDARSSLGTARRWGGVPTGSRLVDSRTAHVPHPPEVAFAPVRRIGGSVGWYYANFLWRLRGALDLLVGGAGLRRGRRDPEQLRVGDALDFWRVEAVDVPRLLRLRAEMRLPGRAWLQFEVSDADGGGSTIRQTAIFEPRGLLGLMYWYGLYVIHGMIFGGMLREIAHAASRNSGARPEPSRGPTTPPRQRPEAPDQPFEGPL